MAKQTNEVPQIVDLGHNYKTIRVREKEEPNEVPEERKRKKYVKSVNTSVSHLQAMGVVAQSNFGYNGDFKLSSNADLMMIREGIEAIKQNNSYISNDIERQVEDGKRKQEEINRSRSKSDNTNDNVNN